MGDFINDIALPHIVSLLEQNSRLAAQKAEEWQREARLQGRSSTPWTPTTTMISRPRKSGRRRILVSDEVSWSNFGS
jgi:hypothetical protein